MTANNTLSVNITSAIVVGLASLALVAGCADQPADRSADPATSTAPASGGPGQATQVVAATTSADAGGGAAGACTPTAAMLLSALKANRSLYDDLNTPSAIHTVECEAGYATGVTSAPNTDPATVLYRFDAAASAWRALKGGTSITCDEVPAAVIAHLSRCPAA